MKPNVIVRKGDGNLGGQPLSQDGVSLLIFVGVSALVRSALDALDIDDNITLYSTRDAEEVGITQAFDTENDCLIWEQIKDFFRAANNAELNVMFCNAADAPNYNPFDTANPAYDKIKLYLKARNGDIKLLGVSFMPSAPDELEFQDVVDIVSTAQAFADEQFNLFRPVSIELEGYGFVPVSTSTDLRTLGSGSVSVTVSRDKRRRLAIEKNEIAHEFSNITLFGTSAGINIPTGDYLGSYDEDTYRLLERIMKADTKFEIRGSEKNDGFYTSLFDGLDDGGTFVFDGLPSATFDVPDANIATAKMIIYTTNSGVNNHYSEIGLSLGRLASMPVQRNKGRVRSGALPGIIEAEFSGGVAYGEVSDTLTDNLHDKGYVFYRQFVEKSGWFFNSDCTCNAITSDFSFQNRTRTLDKACRIVRQVYVDELNDEVAVNQDGTLSPIVIRTFENRLNAALRTQMQERGEIVSYDVRIDPTQNVLATGLIKSTVRVRPFGTVSLIETTVEFETTLTE